MLWFPASYCGQTAATVYVCCTLLLQAVWYAQQGSNILPVVHMPETSQYQVTLSGSHDTFPAGKYTFNFFSESAVGDVRKVCAGLTHVQAFWYLV